jgi:hypothetical protein
LVYDVGKNAVIVASMAYDWLISVTWHMWLSSSYGDKVNMRQRDSLSPSDSLCRRNIICQSKIHLWLKRVTL